MNSSILHELVVVDVKDTMPNKYCDKMKGENKRRVDALFFRPRQKKATTTRKRDQLVSCFEIVLSVYTVYASPRYYDVVCSIIHQKLFIRS
jgi:hypothetical protein